MMYYSVMTQAYSEKEIPSSPWDRRKCMLNPWGFHLLLSCFDSPQGFEFRCVSANHSSILDSLCIDLRSLYVCDDVDIRFVRCLTFALVLSFYHDGISCFQCMVFCIVSLVMVFLAFLLVGAVTLSNLLVFAVDLCCKVV